MYGDIGLIGQPSPSLEQRNAVFDPIRTHVRLQVDVVGAKPSHQLQYGFKIIDIRRIALRLPDHAVASQESSDLCSEGRIDEPDAGAVEAGVTDHRKLRLEWPLRDIRQPSLHCPKRLEHAKLLRHR